MTPLSIDEVSRFWSSFRSGRDLAIVGLMLLKGFAFRRSARAGSGRSHPVGSPDPRARQGEQGAHAAAGSRIGSPARSLPPPGTSSALRQGLVRLPERACTGIAPDRRWTALAVPTSSPNYRGHKSKGSNLLALVLLGYAVVQYNSFAVTLNAGSNSGVQMYQGSSATCLSGYTCGPGLVVTPAGTLPDIVGFTLTGSATNTSTGTINVTTVSTAVGTCPFSITASGTTDSPVGCVGSPDAGANFTFTSFPYTVSIGPGQIVAANVQISFM